MKMNLILCIGWAILAALNLTAGVVEKDLQTVHIAILQGLLAWDRYDDYKRGA